jgi:hypothetical protein
LKWSDGRTETYVELQRVKLAAADLAKYAGRFYSPELDTHFVLEARNGALVVLRPHQEELALEPTARDRFSNGQTRIRFVRDAQGRLCGFTYGEEDLDGIAFLRATPSQSCVR